VTVAQNRLKKVMVKGGIYAEIKRAATTDEPAKANAANKYNFPICVFKIFFSLLRLLCYNLSILKVVPKVPLYNLFHGTTLQGDERHVDYD